MDKTNSEEIYFDKTYPTFEVFDQPTALSFPEELRDIKVGALKSRIDVEVNFMKVVFSELCLDTLYGAGLRNCKLVRYNFKKEKLICRSRLELPRVDSIQEDKFGCLWIFSLGKVRKIFKFSDRLTLLGHYSIDSHREISAYEWSNSTAINKDRDKIYYPSGMGKVGVLIVGNRQDADPEFGYCWDSATKHTIFSLCLSNNEKYLIADQGTRSVRIINVHTGTSFEEHISGSKEKKSNPECVFSNNVIFCGTKRAKPMLAYYEIKEDRLSLKQTITLKSDKVFKTEIMISTQRIDKQGEFERVLTASSHRRLFLLHCSKDKLVLEREFDLSFPRMFKLQFGVKTLFCKGNFAVFYTDNHEKKNCTIRFLE